MKFFSRIRPTASLLVTLALFLVAQSALFGQATGNVTGVVEDSTGAVIPKAVVVLTNLVNGAQSSTTSNAAGAFAFAGLTPATYSFEVTAAGFEPWQTQPFQVHAGDQLGFNSDIRMKVGAATAEVTVEAKSETGIAALDTAEQSDIINADELNTLSVVGRDATELVRMLPGYAMSTGDQGLFNRPGYNTAVVGLSGPTGAFSANGAGVTGIATLTDGVSLTDISSNMGSVQQINIEMVQSVKATNSSFGAVYAKGPAVISAESKEGGSKYHGEPTSPPEIRISTPTTGTTTICASRGRQGPTIIPAGRLAARCLCSAAVTRSCSSLPGTNTTTRASRPISRPYRVGCPP